MKKLISLLFLIVCLSSYAQTFQVQNLQVNGTSALIGVTTLTVPLSVSSGGIGTGTAGGTALDNITGFSSTGFLTRTGANTYSIQSLTNGITLGNLAQVAANTVLANSTSATANVTAFSVPGCSAATNALTWTTNTGFTCNSSINAATLGGATFAAPGPIGSTTASTGAFTTLSASSTVSGSGFTTLLSPYALLASPTFTGTPVAPTAAFGTNTTQLATTAFVDNEIGNFRSLSGINSNGTLTNSTAGNLIQINGASTTSLPLANSVPSGTTYHFINAVTGGIISRSGSDNIINLSGGSITSLNMGIGDETSLTSNGISLWYVSKSRKIACQNILDFGGDSTDTNDNSAAFTAAAGANPTGNVCVFFPPGKFKFTASASFTLPAAPSSIMIMGAGQDVTTLDFQGNFSAISITSSAPGNSAHIRDMTVTTNQNGTTNGINFIQSSSLNQFSGSDIYHVTLRGSDNTGTGGTHYFANSININGQDNVNIESVTVYGGTGPNGVGILCQGPTNQYSIYVNISKSVFNTLATGVIYGNYCQGVTITQSNFQNDVTGVSVPAAATGALSQLQISDSQFATTGNGIFIQTAVGNVFIHDNDIFVHTSVSGIFLSAAAGFSIIGNQISTDGSANTGTNGIAIGTTNAGTMGTITGNTTAGLAVGVLLQAGAKYVNVNSNNYNDGTPTSNSGGAACPPSTSGNCIGTATP
jgi:hypothetical protein